jgi:hypothetical protein
MSRARWTRQTLNEPGRGTSREARFSGANVLRQHGPGRCAVGCIQSEASAGGAQNCAAAERERERNRMGLGSGKPGGHRKLPGIWRFQWRFRDSLRRPPTLPGFEAGVCRGVTKRCKTERLSRRGTGNPAAAHAKCEVCAAQPRSTQLHRMARQIIQHKLRLLLASSY